MIQRIDFFSSMRYFISFFQCLQDFVCGRNLIEFRSQFANFVNGLLMIYGIPTFAHDFPDSIEGFLVGVSTRLTSVSQKLFLLFLFRIKYFQLNQSFVHTDSILPVIG